ncbi:polysaccharide deacetylase family protein [Marinimicrobium koreense]|uniref:polysaccharide deacetylase family protein n=1 Tax=Marinimicrobium koreense TaxID=306545 RepID=UPI003F71E871
MNRWIRRAMTSRGLERCFSALSGPYVTIFMLHRPLPGDRSYHGTSEKLLEECLQFAVKQKYDFIALDDLIDRAVQGQRIKRPTLCFTLDDGYSDQVTRLIPVLLKYDAKPTLFVITDFIDGKDWPWDAKISYLIRNSRLREASVVMQGSEIPLKLDSVKDRVHSRRLLSAYAKRIQSSDIPEFVDRISAALDVETPFSAPEDYLPASWDQLREAEKAGVTIGSHARSHFVLSAMNPGTISEELVYSKARLKEELQSPSQIFCYPSGTTQDFSRNHELMVRMAHYRGAVSTISQTSYLKDIRRNPYRVARIGFPGDFDQFMRYASWIEALRSKLPV